MMMFFNRLIEILIKVIPFVVGISIIEIKWLQKSDMLLFLADEALDNQLYELNNRNKCLMNLEIK